MIIQKNMQTIISLFYGIDSLKNACMNSDIEKMMKIYGKNHTIFNLNKSGLNDDFATKVTKKYFNSDHIQNLHFLNYFYHLIGINIKQHFINICANETYFLSILENSDRFSSFLIFFDLIKEDCIIQIKKEIILIEDRNKWKLEQREKEWADQGLIYYG